MSGLDITSNCSIFFQAEDYQGNIKASNSISITEINTLSINDFSVKFDLNSTYETFICYFKDLSLSPYYDIYLKVDGFESYRMQIKNASDFRGNNTDYSQDYILINSNTLYEIHNTGSADLTFNFKVINNITNNVVITKTYRIKLGAKVTDNGSIISGSSTDSGGNSTDLGINNDSNFNNNSNSIFSDNVFDNTSNAINYITNFFESIPEIFNLIGYFFSCFPNWLVAPLTMGVFLVVAIAIIKFVRG